MKHLFDEALSLVLVHEGGYVNHRADPGGPTNLGVTLATAKRYGLDIDLDGDVDVVDVKLLKPEHAAVVYRRGYWDAVRGDELPPGVDYCTFDAAVNSGPSRAAKWLQRALGVKADGMIGPVTLDAAWAADRETTIKRMCADRLKWLRRLSTWGSFGKGWSRRVAGVEAAALEMAARPPSLDPEPVPPPPEPGLPASWWVRLIRFFFPSFMKG